MIYDYIWLHCVRMHEINLNCFNIKFIVFSKFNLKWLSEIPTLIQSISHPTVIVRPGPRPGQIPAYLPPPAPAKRLQRPGGVRRGLPIFTREGVMQEQC